MGKYQHLGGTFWKSDKQVIADWHRLKLDPRSTKVFFGTWACDGNYVYWRSHLCRGLSAESFHAHNRTYATDGQLCYCNSIRVKLVDTASFQVCDSGYYSESGTIGGGEMSSEGAGFATDGTRVFYLGSLITSADPESFKFVGGHYGVDDQSVFFKRFRLPKAKPSMWIPLAENYSRSEDRIYYENKLVKSARAPFFSILPPADYSFAYDGKDFYSRDEIIPQKEYVDFFRKHAGYDLDHLKNIESGKWQNVFASSEWHDSEPDDTLLTFRDVSSGTRLFKKSALEKLIGPGEVVPRADYEHYFPPTEEIIRDGMNAAGGTISWEGTNTTTPDSCCVLAWHHPKETLACAFMEEKMVAFVLLKPEYAKPKSSPENRNGR